MIDGISGAPIVLNAMPYADLFNDVATAEDFFPCVVAAVGWIESIGGQVAGKWDAATVISGDNGHGIMQLTENWPDDWDEPRANIEYAIQHFLFPAYQFWRNYLSGDDLVRAIAAEYNEGRGNAIAAHEAGDFDKYTSDDYAARALKVYRALSDGNRLT